MTFIAANAKLPLRSLMGVLGAAVFASLVFASSDSQTAEANHYLWGPVYAPCCQAMVIALGPFPSMDAAYARVTNIDTPDFTASACFNCPYVLTGLIGGSSGDTGVTAHCANDDGDLLTGPLWVGACVSITGAGAAYVEFSY